MANDWPSGLIRIFQGLGGDPEKGQPVLVDPLGNRFFNEVDRQIITGSVAQVDFTTGLDSTYNFYTLVGTSIVPAVDGNIECRISVASSFKAGTSYHRASGTFFANNTSSFVGSTASSTISITFTAGNAATESSAFILFISDPSNTALYKNIMGISNALNDSTLYQVNVVGGAWLGGTGAVDGIRIFSGAGNILSGNFMLHGWL